MRLFNFVRIGETINLLFKQLSEVVASERGDIVPWLVVPEPTLPLCCLNCAGILLEVIILYNMDLLSDWTGIHVPAAKPAPSYEMCSLLLQKN